MSHPSPWKPSVICRFQNPDTRGDVLRGNTREFSMQEDMQSSVHRRLCSSASLTRQEAPILSHCDGTSKSSDESEPGELLTSVFLPFVPISYSNCSGRRTRICFLWNVSAWLGISRPLPTSALAVCGLCIQFVATDLLMRSLSNHTTSCSTHKPKNLPLNPLKNHVSYLVSSVAM